MLYCTIGVASRTGLQAFTPGVHRIARSRPLLRETNRNYSLRTRSIFIPPQHLDFAACAILYRKPNMNAPTPGPIALHGIDELPINNAFAQLPPAFYTRLDPTPVPSPYLVGASAEAARLIGLDPAEFARP